MPRSKSGGDRFVARQMRALWEEFHAFRRRNYVMSVHEPDRPQNGRGRVTTHSKRLRAKRKASRR